MHIVEKIDHVVLLGGGALCQNKIEKDTKMTPPLGLIFIFSYPSPYNGHFQAFADLANMKNNIKKIKKNFKKVLTGHFFRDILRSW